ncbi:type II toxin-antitoxin system RelE/ParE family toxin [Deferrisoma camini]|uniref:type II toxin-antitoxin system RelE/ParE family toxin n=1 Tax=Deferrisoma camini TaxID=1035120 RepID=UPI00046CC134|nr:type II toxin-antitoxin system RelE/ParE family toxin [Deferrisoma camini]
MLRIQSEAEKDLATAYDWYEARQPGLGAEFLAEIDAVLSRIGEAPTRYPVVHRGVRRALARRFPYGVFYLIAPDAVVVIAVLHAARDPALLRRRSKSV